MTSVENQLSAVQDTNNLILEPLTVLPKKLMMPKPKKLQRTTLFGGMKIVWKIMKKG